MVDVLELLHECVDDMGLAFEQSPLRCSFIEVQGCVPDRLRLRRLLNASDRRSMVIHAMGGTAVQFVVLADDVLHLQLGVVNGLLRVELALIVVNGVLFNRRRAGAVGLHMIGPVARLEVHRLILLLLVRPRWLQRVF